MRRARRWVTLVAASLVAGTIVAMVLAGSVILLWAATFWLITHATGLA